MSGADLCGVERWLEGGASGKYPGGTGTLSGQAFGRVRAFVPDPFHALGCHRCLRIAELIKSNLSRGVLVLVSGTATMEQFRCVEQC